MFICTQEERFWLVRNLAVGLVRHLQVDYPPVWVENLIKKPPAIFQDSERKPSTGRWDSIYQKHIYRSGKVTKPLDLPIDERRYAIAREILIAMGGSKHGRDMGLPEILLPHLEECQDYFARVLLAPDSLVASYRKQRRDLRGFAETFLMPTRIATLRWEDPLLP
ncbi:MAG TPA: hypothetical protein VGA07_13595 [Anaerolineales bacterium]